MKQVLFHAMYLQQAGHRLWRQPMALWKITCFSGKDNRIAAGRPAPRWVPTLPHDMALSPHNPDTRAPSFQPRAQRGRLGLPLRVLFLPLLAVTRTCKPAWCPSRPFRCVYCAATLLQPREPEEPKSRRAEEPRSPKQLVQFFSVTSGGADRVLPCPVPCAVCRVLLPAASLLQAADVF
ncbi:hypothetical protein EYF80_021533 [Liparis tanakae]|uniref:Uncharacterized protein n=1 Tax=Liparis tanakae TaxID=230148 RepID=A0A4Z2HRL1_9TELE|nr:hypothetical protein EYF80_021533 [Liparis tanakae]